MKKIVFKTLVLLFIGLTTVSCSSDDSGDNPGSTTNEIKMTVDGTTYTFNTVVVNANTQNFLGEPAVQVTGTINNATDRIVNIIVNQSATGSNSLDEFIYTANGKTYSYGSIGSTGSGNCITNSNLNFVTSVNDGSSISGNFSGNLDICNTNDVLESITITSGSFKATY